MDKRANFHRRKRIHLAPSWEAGQRGNAGQQLGVRARGWHVTHPNRRRGCGRYCGVWQGKDSSPGRALGIEEG